MRKKNGDLFPGVLSGELIEVDRAQSGLTVVHDATERKLAEERLKEMSRRDPLTGILNYRAFYEAAEARLAAVSDARIAVLFMDLDGLKRINDEFGHPAGDQALRVFADVLRRAFRESDVIGRLGGDEFTVVAISREDVSDEALVARFSAELDSENASAGLPFEISASVGISRWEPSNGAVDLQELIRVADARMYEAKRARGGE
jgi:diguanylate cyclase (GGDEF)-like protein